MAVICERHFELGRGALDTPPQLSVVVPTFNEAGNIQELLAQLAQALPRDLVSEIIFVDDSTDDTPDIIAAAAGSCPIAVRLRHRDRPIGGLGGAVLDGVRM